jgi:hypothetical protein
MNALRPWHALILASFIVTALWLGLSIEAATRTGATYVDEGTFHYSAWLWFSGEGLPYRDVFENKPPGIFVLFGATELLLGSPYPAVRLASLAAAIATILCMGALFRRLLPLPPALLAAGFFGLMILAPYTDPYMAVTERFMVLFTCAGLLAAAKAEGRFWGAALSGLLCSLALAFKQAALLENALIAVVCATGWPFAADGRFRLRTPGLVGWLSGWLLLQGGILGGLAAQGIADDYLHVVWGSLGGRGMAPPTLLDKLDNWMIGLNRMATALAVAWLALPALWSRLRKQPFAPPHLAAFGGWWLLLAAPTAVGGWAWIHRYIQIFPALAFLGALALAELWRHVAEPSEGPAGQRLRTGITGLLAVLLVVTTIPNAHAWVTYVGGEASPDLSEPARILEEISEPDDRMFVVQWLDGLHAISGRRGASRYTNRNFLGQTGVLEQVRQDVLGEPPELIAISSDRGGSASHWFGEERGAEVDAFYREVEELAETDYRLVATTEACRIYQRIDDRGDPSRSLQATRQPAGDAGAEEDLPDE